MRSTRHTTYVIASEHSMVPSTWLVNDWRIRLRRGYKGPNDTLIEVSSPGGQLIPLSLASIGAIVSLWYRNEDRLYPQGSGGRYVLSFLEACCQEGGIEDACRLHRLRPPAIELIKPVLTPQEKSDYRTRHPF